MKQQFEANVNDRVNVIKIQLEWIEEMTKINRIQKKNMFEYGFKLRIF